MILHPESAVDFDLLGKVGRPYLPNFPVDGYINPEHRWFSECEMDGVCIKAPIQGWLQAADALKLYEMAYFANGDILELGTAFGLSTSIMAKAVKSSERSCRIETVELDPKVSAQAARNLRDHGVANCVNFNVGDAESVCSKMALVGRKFGFAFIDHSHAYWPVYKSNLLLKDLLAPGGLALFHDYNDPRNAKDKLESDASGVYGVYAAVHDSLSPKDFEFVGVYGCTGLFHRRA